MRLLQARGWAVASIPFFEWKLHRGLAAQQAYLRTKLPQVLNLVSEPGKAQNVRNRIGRQLDSVFSAKQS